MTGLQFGLIGLALIRQLMTANASGETTFTPISSAVRVTETTGVTEYSYDSTGWKLLKPGKILLAGANVRAAKKSEVIMKAVDAPVLIKVVAGTQVHLTLDTEE